LTRRKNFHRIRKVRVFLTGGSGFIGGHLVDRLLSQGAEVTALVRDPDRATSLREKNVRVLRGDLFSIPSLPAGLDVVIHLAGRTRSLQSSAYYTVNQAGTASLCRALLASGAKPKFICLSSLAAVGPCRDGRSIRETDEPHPVTPYGRSKWLGEQEVLKFRNAFRVVIVRPSAIFGPGDRDFLEYFRLIRKGFMPVVTRLREASICYVKDLAEALWLCALKDVPNGEIFNIAASPPCTWEQVGDAAAEAMGVRVRKLRVPLGVIFAASVLSELRSRVTGEVSLFNRDKYRDLRQPGWVADTEKAGAVLSFRPRYTLDEGMRETIDWYREQRLL
jgi:nucleoside-diphosphate-sugar epimerase